MKEETKINWLEVIRSLNVPDWLTDNIITALGKGIYGIITSASEIPIAHIKNRTERIKMIGEIEREFIKKAAEHPLYQIETHPELARRALENYGIKLIEEQINKEQLIPKTLENIAARDIPENKPENALSQDWLTAFWNLAATKSEDDIQNILTKILSNEIINPGTLSLHTLQTLSILDGLVGISFTKLCNLAIDDGLTPYFIHPNVFAFQNIGPLTDYGLNFHDLLALEGSGLIRSAETIRLNFKESESEREYDKIEYAGINGKIDVSGMQLNLIYFSQAGKELRKLIDIEENQNYTEKLKAIFGKSLVLEK